MRRLEAMVEADGEGGLRVLSPAVGLYGGAPRRGEILVGGSRAGWLSALGRTAELVLPAGATGRVTERALSDHRDPVAYGQLLLHLGPVAAGEGLDSGELTSSAAAHGLAEGCHAVVSPTHGMFYRRPRPDAPAYVEVGQTVEVGATLALVEVMKCFSAITYGGPGLPPRAEVLEVREADGAEVQADQVLFVVRGA